METLKFGWRQETELNFGDINHLPLPPDLQSKESVSNGTGAKEELIEMDTDSEPILIPKRVSVKLPRLSIDQWKTHDHSVVKNVSGDMTVFARKVIPKKLLSDTERRRERLTLLIPVCENSGFQTKEFFRTLEDNAITKPGPKSSKNRKISSYVNPVIFQKVGRSIDLPLNPVDLVPRIKTECIEDESNQVEFRQDSGRHDSTLQCECGVSFPDIGALIVHGRICVMQKEHPCQICKKVFVNKVLLDKHQKIHIAEKTAMKPPIKLIIKTPRPPNNAHAEKHVSRAPLPQNTAPKSKPTFNESNLKSEKGNLYDLPIVIKSEITDTFNGPTGDLESSSMDQDIDAMMRCATPPNMSNDSTVISPEFEPARPNLQNLNEKAVEAIVAEEVQNEKSTEVSKSPRQLVIKNEEAIDDLVIDNEEFSNDGSGVKSEPTVKPFPCDKCGQGFTKKGFLKYHERTCNGQSICPHCSKEFSSKYTLQTHVLRVHVAEKKFKCATCGKGFKDNGSLIRHQLVHSEERPFKCQQCDKSFKMKQELDGHVRTHTDERPFHCEICGKSFKQACGLSEHKRRHTGKKDHTCDICQKSFVDRGSLVRHAKIHTGIKPHKCEVCNMSFTLKHTLTQHQTIHTGVRPYSCKVCNKTFRETTALRYHEMCHNDARPFECKVCGKRFRVSHALKIHERRHTGEKPFQCTICGKRFIDSSGLYQHKNKNRCKGNEASEIEIDMANEEEEEEEEEEFDVKNELIDETSDYQTPGGQKQIHSCDLCNRMFGSAEALENHRVSCSAEQFPAPSKVTGSIPQIASNESPLRSGQPNSNPGAVNIDIDANSIKIEYEDDYE